jgi:hypothetical protein
MYTKKIMMAAILIHLLLGIISLIHPQTFGPDIMLDSITPGIVNQKYGSIAIDRENHVCVAWIDAAWDGVWNTIVMFGRSYDGGLTFQQTVVFDEPLTDPYEFARGEVALAMDSKGNPWVGWQLLIFSTAIFKVCRSTDGGRSFQPPFFTENGEEGLGRDWLSIDEADNVYILWLYSRAQLMLTTFSGGATNQSTTVTVNSVNPDSVLVSGMPTLEVLGEGEVGIVWSSYNNANPQRWLIFSKSEDAGKTIHHSVFVDRFEADSLSSGQWWPDITSDDFGNIHVVWSDDRSGDPDVYLSKSEDGGETFFESKRINEFTQSTYSLVALCTHNRSSGLGVVWDWSVYADIYFRRSTDGGENFEHTIVVNDSTASGSKYLGGIASDDSGNVHVLFHDARTDDYRIYLSKATFEATNVEVCPVDAPIPKDVALQQNYPNPFNTATIMRYTVPMAESPQHIILKIYNILGREIKTLVDEEKRSGMYQVTWDGKDETGRDVASGVYFYKLRVGNLGTTKKLVVLR